jgi:serine/threonine protein kinase
MTDIPSRLSAALADRYRMDRQLGEGGMATVYRAEDLKHDRKDAAERRLLAFTNFYEPIRHCMAEGS